MGFMCVVANGLTDMEMRKKRGDGRGNEQDVKTSVRGVFSVLLIS